MLTGTVEGVEDFRIGRMEEQAQSMSGYQRRSFYKISLLTKGEGILFYADKEVPIKDNALIFTNPLVPFSYKSLSAEKEQGFFCLFTNKFIDHSLHAGRLAESPLFRAGGNNVVVPDEQTTRLLCLVYERLIAEERSGYGHKQELIGAYIQVIIQEALKIESPEKNYRFNSSAGRLTDLFLTLLETQFAMVSPASPLELKNANEYAAQLSVHPNHLNRVLKTTTGKSTIDHINERTLSEARSLLLHTDLTIGEIGDSLGFNHATNFQAFFKRQTGTTANGFRKQHVAKS